jgi:aquaporin Z
METIISSNVETEKLKLKGEQKLGEDIERKITEVPSPPPAVPQISPTKKYIAELIGTMVLVLFGCGSAVIAGSFVGNLGVAFAFGLAVLVMVYAIGSVSGCHINPAISISMLIAGKISIKDTVFYIIFQCIGAIVGAGILYAVASGNASYSLAFNGLGANKYSAYSLGAVFLAEVVLTFIFILVVHGSTNERVPKGFAGLAIGFTLVLCHIVAIPIDGTSVNPARSLGPALFVGGKALNQLWVFWVAPIIGGIIAAIVWKIFK